MKASPDLIWNTFSAQRSSSMLAEISGIQNMRSFLRDVMTEKKILEIGARLEAGVMPHSGAKYGEITQRTKLSSRTITRIGNLVQNGCSEHWAALGIVDQHHSHIVPARAG
jgi:uncharacterized protein YerC